MFNKIEEIKEEILKSSVSKVVNKFILEDVPVCFNGNKDLILELKESLVSKFKIHFKNIEIVGSAKLGFSLSEERFGQSYNSDSDIDLVLVSSELFDIAWHELLELDFQYYKLTPKERDYLGDCYDTIPRGFISPNKLPPITNFYSNWWKIFSDLSNKEKYEYRQIRGRLFKNWWFAEKYYSIKIRKLTKT